MKINQLFSLVYLLLERKSMTAKELAEHFEVSYRTILRDIEALSEAGVPIYTRQGKGGGISIYDSYVLDKTLISEEDQNKILFALQGMSAIRDKEDEELLKRLQSVFAKSNKEWVEVSFSPWGSNVNEEKKFEKLREAIINEKEISFSYYNSEGDLSYRRAHPLKLSFKERAWYLKAFCLFRNDYRTFKINRMKLIEVLTAEFDSGDYEIPKEQYSKSKADRMFMAKLKFNANMAYRVYDEFLEEEILKDKEGKFIVDFLMEDDDWYYDYLMSFGTGVEVLEPKSVRDEMVRRVEFFREKYK